MPYKWREEQTPKFLDLFREHECLWNDKCDDYKNREERARAIQSMISGLGIVGLVEEDIKLKIKTIRTRYACELVKIKRSRQSGETVYMPKLFWFSQADTFLNNVVRPRPISSNVVDTSEEAPKYSTPKNSTRLKRPAPKEEEIEEESVEYIDFDQTSPAIDHQEQDMQTHSRHNIDEYEAIGINVAAKLRRMKPAQAIYAEMLINKTITCGLLNKLSCNTDLSDEPS